VTICTDCGQALRRGDKYCASCGALRNAGADSRSGRPGDYRGAATTPLPLVYLFSKSGGWLALKSFLVVLAVGVVGQFPARSFQERPWLLFFSFGIGAAYLVAKAMHLRRETMLMLSVGVAWTGMVLISVTYLGNLIGPPELTRAAVVFANGTPEALGSSSSTEYPKEVLLRDVELTPKWHVGWLGSMLVADFRVNNPTKYRFKDFTIKCTHFAPSGTEAGSNTQTIYQVMNAASTQTFVAVNMGFNHTHAASSACVLRDVTVMP